MKKAKLFLVAVTTLLGGVLYAQDLEVKGLVTDSATGEPVPFASIQLKGTMTGTSTDADGKYVITVPDDGVLIFSSIGYKSAEVPVNGASMVNVELHTDAEFLEETIVVAYGTTTRQAFTGSAAVVKEETLERRQVSNVTNALSGTVAGVQTISATGQPGESASVRIRGIGSMYAGTSPLYIVDGIPYEGDISAINTQDIASMTVLKDAAASALYGARGANGVILITTKKGSGDAKVSFDARWGTNSRLVKNYDVLTSPKTYMETAYDALYNSYFYGTGYDAMTSHQMAVANLNKSLGYTVYTVPDGQMLIGTNGLLNPQATLGYSDGEYFYTPDNWEEEMFQKNLRQEYNVSISGGNEKLNYYLSAGFLGDEGIIQNSGFQRITTRLNVDYNVRKWLTIGTNIGYTNSTSRYPGDQDAAASTSSANAFYVANSIAPIYPIYVRDAAGNIMYDKNTGYKIYDYGDSKSTNFTRNFMNMSNPMSDLLYNKEEYLMDIFNGKWFARLTPVKGLTVTASWGLHIDNTRVHQVGNKYYGQSSSSGGSVIQQSARSLVFDQQYIANYKNTFGEHTVDAMVGFESMSYESESHYILGYNIYNDDNWTASNVIDRKNGSGSYDTYATMGVISRVSYDFGEKYYASASYRRDASSRFHPDHRWGNFWSVSAAWNIANEGFMSSADKVDMLKLKASFGQQGNDDLRYNSGASNFYPYIDQYQVTGADGVFSDGTLYYKGNKDITWEKSNSFNTGLDFSFFGNRLVGTVEYFLRQTDDMLYFRPVAPSNGYTEIPMNVGSVRNSGVEIDLNYTPVSTRNVNWTINWNGTMLKNKIIALNPELKGEMISGSYIYCEGESLYQFYIVDYAGVDPETGLAQYLAKDEETGKEYATSDWSKAYDTNRKGQGDLLPFIYGGIGTTVDFFGFDFSIQCSYQLGGQIYDSGYSAMMHGGLSGDMGHNWHKDILKAWRKPGDITDVPRLDNVQQYTNSTSTRWLTSSDYFAINNITLGYTFPKKWMKKLHIDSIRIYGSADNLALFSARKGLDPRMSYTVASTSSYTAIRSISGGIKLTF